MDCQSGHWSEECFDEELMTPRRDMTRDPNKVSEMTIASLVDMGYKVDYSKVETKFRKWDLDSSCRCNRRSSGGLLWLWDNPTQRRWNGPSSDLVDKAKSYGSPRSFVGSNNEEIRTTSTMIVRDENDKLHEITSS